VKRYLNKQRLKVVVYLNSIRSKVSNIKLSQVVRSRAFLLGVYVLVMVGLAGVWWWNSPYRLSRSPIDLPDAPPVSQQPTEPNIDDPGETEPTQADPVEPDPVKQPETTTTNPPLVEEPAVPVLSLNVAVDKLKKPVEGAIIAPFGFKWSKTFEDFRYHHGVGIASTQGTPVVAAYAGRVASVVQDDPEWGVIVTIDHGSGWKTLYSSLAKVSVTTGQAIKEGQQIGQVGPNPPAKSADGPQLYFALYQGDESVDPTHMFN